MIWHVTYPAGCWFENAQTVAMSFLSKHYIFERGLKLYKQHNELTVCSTFKVFI